MIDKISKTSFV